MTTEERILFYSRKSGYGWLSNFWREPMLLPLEPFDKLPEKTTMFPYPTNEHYYQSQKAKTMDARRWIAWAPTPYAAMLAGRSLRPHEIREDWDRVRVNAMLTGLRKKFRLGSDLGDLLLGTGYALIEEDSPTDRFWGRLGENMLGKCLMEVRGELRTDLENQR